MASNRTSVSGCCERYSIPMANCSSVSPNSEWATNAHKDKGGKEKRRKGEEEEDEIQKKNPTKVVDDKNRNISSKFIVEKFKHAPERWC